MRSLWFLILVGACAPTLPTLHEVSAAMEKADAHPDENSPQAKELRDRSEALAKRAVCLGKDPCLHPVAVFSCIEPTGDPAYRCEGVVADDTIHLVEFMSGPRLPRKDLVVQGLEGATWYVGEPEEMHKTGYATTRSVRVDKSGALVLPTLSEKPHVLFTLVSVGRWTLKYVWLV